jgi:hypothetical protein
MRVKLRGINRAVVKLAGGRVVTYWYAWRGGPSLPGKPGDPEFVAAYNAAIATKIAPTPGTLRAVLVAYQASSEFTRLRSRTQKDYRWHIACIEAKFAKFPLAALTDRRTRGIFKVWRDELGKHSARQADITWAVLGRAMSGVRYRANIARPCRRGD